MGGLPNSRDHIMRILVLIAWRNIWRNPRRSGVLISSIAVGVIGYLGTSGFSRGFLNQMVDTTIDLQGGHIMIAAAGYHDNPNVRTFIRRPGPIAAVLEQTSGLDHAPLVAFQGMISSSEKSAGVMIHGVQPELEGRVTVVPDAVIRGRYLSGQNAGSHEIVVGEELARRLNVDLGEKVVLMTSDLERNISSGAYRLAGIFRTASPAFDKSAVFLNLPDAQQLAGYRGYLTAFVLRLHDPDEVDDTTASLRQRLADPHLEVLSWKDRNRLLVLAMRLYDFSLVIMIVILFVAIAFSIANAFLMVIYERIHEIGIMMANGVLPRKIRLMLYIEAFFINWLGTILGAIFSAGLLAYFGHVGLDLSDFAQGLGSFGVGSIVYPAVTAFDVILGFVVINLIIWASVFYPAIKASRFEPVDAIRFV